jgi:hypothetical protein
MKNGQGARIESAAWYAPIEYLIVPSAISGLSIYNRALVVNIDRMTLLHPAIRAA